MRHSFAVLVVCLIASVAPSANAQGLTLDPPTMAPPVPRLRIGAELGGGIAYGATDGGALALYGQIGAQITPQLGLFYQGALFGYGFGNGDEVDTFLVSSHSAMVDLTFANVAQVGIGGGLDVGSFSYCEDRTGICTSYARAVHPSLSLRAAFLVGFLKSRARWGVPIALHAHTMLWENRPQGSLVLTVGFSRY